jgi:Flp pilus assembly protein TadG
MTGAARRFRREDGQTLVEFAVVAPLLIILLFGIVQFGLVFHQYLGLTDAVRAGARQAVIAHDVASATAAVQNATGDLDQSKLSVVVTPSSSDWASGTDVTVTATYPYSIDILGVVVKSGRFTSTMTERVE